MFLYEHDIKYHVRVCSIEIEGIMANKSNNNYNKTFRPEIIGPDIFTQFADTVYYISFLISG